MKWPWVAVIFKSKLENCSNIYMFPGEFFVGGQIKCLTAKAQHLQILAIWIHVSSKGGGGKCLLTQSSKVLLRKYSLVKVCCDWGLFRSGIMEFSGMFKGRSRNRNSLEESSGYIRVVLWCENYMLTCSKVIFSKQYNFYSFFMLHWQKCVWGVLLKFSEIIDKGTSLIESSSVLLIQCLVSPEKNGN